MAMDRKKRLKRTRRKLRDRVVVSALKLASRLTPVFSLETVQRLSNGFGNILSKFPGARRRRVVEHLRIAFPEMADSERTRILRASYRSMVCLFMEALWVPGWRKGEDDRRVRIATPATWEKTLRLASEHGRGLVIYTAHLGTVELLARWFTDNIGMPVLAVAARPKMEGLVELTKRQRESSGYRVVWRGDAGIAAVRHLRAGGCLIMMVDHNLRGPGVSVPFFGREAHSLLAPARLALQSGAVANTMFCLRDGVGRVFVEADEPILPVPYPTDRDERFRLEAELVKEYTRRIEEKIRRYPDQYLWMHKRWVIRSETLPYPA
jgi:KDO2-lipid IV(A) lauroyltransferase